MPNTPVIEKVTERHADELAFLAAQRKNILTSPLYTLKDILQFDNRLAGHIDGLALGGDVSWKYCVQNLAFEEIGEVFTAAALAIAMDDMEKLNQVFDIAGENTALLDAIADAFVWHSYEQTKDALENLFHQKECARKYVALATYTGYGYGPEQLEQYLIYALDSENDHLIQRAFFTIGELGLISLLPQLKLALSHDDEDVRFAASWSATRFGNAQAMENLKEFVFHPGHGDMALHYVVLQKDQQNTLEILSALYQNEDTRRLSIKGHGYVGSTAFIPKLIEVMDDPEFARIAGESFCTITGINLINAGMDSSTPEGFSAGPTDDVEDENVALDIDDDLPWPDAEKIKQWWSTVSNSKHFSEADAYILGKPVSPAHFKYVLVNGNQPQRLFAARYLGLLRRSKPIFNVFAPAKRQKQELVSL